MKKDDEGNRVFETPSEALWAQRDFSLRIVRWLRQIVDDVGADLPSFPYYRSLINTWANATARWIIEREKQIMYLREKVQTLSEERDELRALLKARGASHSSSP